MHSNNQDKVSSSNDVLNISLWLIINFQYKNSKMASVVKYIIVLAMFIQIAQSGILAYAICLSTCKTAWLACYTAAGGTVGISTIGLTVVTPVIMACNIAEDVCMAVCDAVCPLPTP